LCAIIMTLEAKNILRKGAFEWNAFKKKRKKTNIKEGGFQNIQFEGYNFRNVNFSKISFAGSVFVDCDFSTSTLFDCNFTGAVFTNCNFFETTLSCSLLNNSKVSRCDFKRADLIGCEIKSSYWEFADMRYSRLEDADFTSSLLSDCKIYGASIWSTKGYLNEASTLIITPDYEADIVTRDLYLAQYLYLMNKRGIVNAHNVRVFDPILEQKKSKYNYHVFISYASEDKENIAQPLAKMLSDIGLRVWFDTTMLSLGDSLREKIDEGLSKSLLGIVILSKNFFKKSWTTAELNAIFSIDLARKNYLIPVWYEITASELLDYSPLLADKIAVIFDGDMNSVVVKILKEVNKLTTVAGSG
jgi:TIR domain/Pentapeptide repeats (9 copies)